MGTSKHEVNVEMHFAMQDGCINPKNLSYPIPSASLVSKRTNCGGPIAAMVRLR